MASFNKFNKFVLNLGNKVFNLGSDSLKIALTNTTPSSATVNQLSDITEISYTNCSSRAVTTTSFTQTAGVAKLILSTLILTASGTVGPFEWVILYDDTATNKEVIGYWDFGSAVTLANGDTFTIAFDGSAGVLTDG